MESRELAHNLANDFTVLENLILTINADIKGSIPDNVQKLLNQLQNKIVSTSNTIKGILKKEQNFDIVTLINKTDFEPDINIQFRNNQNEFILKGNQSKFIQMIENLLRNAQEAKAKNVLITFHKNFFVIEDDGEGFNDKVLQIINVNKPISTKKKGHGIGLLFVKKVCREMNLVLRISNLVTKKGAKFIFEKPPS